MNSESKYIIPNLKNACRVLKLLGKSPKGLALREISQELDIPHTSTIRILNTLESECFVSKTKKTYRLGTTLTRLNLQQAQDFDLRAIAIPALKDLAIETDETAHLAIPSGFKTMILEVCDSPHPVRVTSLPGTVAEAHCSSTGKVFIAHLFVDQLDELVAENPLTARTDRTITSTPELRKEIERVREQGYALDDEEFFDGVRCLAAPVFDQSGSVIAAIGITAGIQRFTRKRIPQVARVVRQAADAISKQVII